MTESEYAETETEPDVEPEVEPPEAQTPGGGGTPGTQTITTRTKDYLGRALSNIATDARDYLGRQTKAGDLDYLGRPLKP